MYIETIGTDRIAGLPELRRFLDHVREGALERERLRQPPFEQVDRVRRERIGALRLPRSLGGAGFSLRELFGFVIELGEADPSFAHVLRNHYYFVEDRLVTLALQKKSAWLDEVSAGRIFSYASTELGTPKAGTADFNRANMSTALSRDGDFYRLNGTKYYSTGSLYSDLVVVRTLGLDGEPLQVVVPARREGVHLDDDWDGIGQRLSGSGTTRFENVRIEPTELLTDSARFKKPRRGAAIAQLYLTAIIAGILRNIVRDSVALLKNRRRSYYHAPAERPVDDPLLQLHVGEFSSAAFAAESMVLAAADALDEVMASAEAGALDEERILQAALRTAKAKVVIDKLALDAATALFDAGGASATGRGLLLDRHWRNIRTLASHNPRSYKARAIGQHEIDRTPLPTGGFF